jgi:hypothetical protein
MSNGSSSKYFIHFGCWNNGGCPKNNDLTKVMNKIKSLEFKPQFLSICGDNYYPPVEVIKEEGKKDIKKKYLQMDNLISGFNCLPKDIDIFMTYGNHDFETNLFINDLEREDKCTLTKNEINIVNEINAVNENFKNISLKLFQSTELDETTKILFLDTTLYDDTDISESAQCYKIIDEKYESIDNAKNDQLEFIRNFVTSLKSDDKVKNIIIVGHHPLTQYKFKKGKMVHLTLNPVFNDILYNEIYVKLNKEGEIKEIPINYYYLCADLHQYQSGNVIINSDMHLKQYIVGTAGAKKDELIKELLFKDPQIDGNIQYHMDKQDIANSTDKNGFLNCFLEEGGNLRFEFTIVDNLDNVAVGGKRKTKNRRNKNNRKTKKIRKYYKRRQTTKMS